MSKKNQEVEVAQGTVVPVEEVATPVAPVAPTVAEVPAAKSDLPDNKLVRFYLEDGYELSDWRTISRDEAKAKADELRAAGFLAAYITLLGGKFSVFSKVAPEKEVKPTSAPKPAVPVEFEGLKFESGKKAREFARRLLDAAREAELRFDLAEAAARKSEAGQG
jgi:hypothetical protein